MNLLYVCIILFRHLLFNSKRSLLAPNMRLTGSHPYYGYVQIKDGLTWRYIVVNEMWDENLPKMLCNHLGFNAMENDFSSGQCGKGCKIASGDLVCYNTLPSRTSCCVHLQPSVAREIVSLPYARCKFTCFTKNYKLVRPYSFVSHRFLTFP